MTARSTSFDNQPFQRCGTISSDGDFSRKTPASRCIFVFFSLKVARRIRHEDVVDVLRGLFMAHGIPEHIRSDNGPEFVAAGLRRWLDQSGVGPLYIAPGSPWENGYAESFNSRFRDEFLGCEVFDDVHSAQALGMAWRVSYNEYRPHSSLGYQTPAEFARTCIASTAASATPQPSFQQYTSLQP